MPFRTLFAPSTPLCHGLSCRQPNSSHRFSTVPYRPCSHHLRRHHGRRSLQRRFSTPAADVDVQQPITGQASVEGNIVVLIVASAAASPYGPPWFDVMKHIAQRLRWTQPRSVPTVTPSMDTSELSSLSPDLVLFVGLSDEDYDETFLKTLVTEKRPEVVLCFENLTEKLAPWISLKGFNPAAPALFQQVQLWLPSSPLKAARRSYATLESLWIRQTSDDLVYLFQFAAHEFITALPEMAGLEPDFNALRCMGTHCRDQILRCLLDPECRKALDCLSSCGMNDQVGSYRCIASYESKLLEEFSLCILQKHNCLGKTAAIPQLPEVHPMETFCGAPLTFEAAEEIFIGQLGNQSWSWKVALGKNPAYDYFPCQFQLFYRGKSRGSMWYDPVFKVITLDGRQVWRRRHYRVRRDKKPGSYYFSVLDNGVTSLEYWRIVDADDGLTWALFYYAGAAAAAGISYTGAVLGTVDGQPPPESQMPRVRAALERCGIQMWELSRVDYASCEYPPLEIPSQLGN